MIFKLIKSFKKKFHKVDTNIKPLEEQELRQRESELFDEKSLYYQRLFEKWTVKEEWKLEAEGIYLLLGTDPEQGLSEDNAEHYHQYNDLLCHAKQCVNQGLLPVINQSEPEINWKVTPVDLYRWASISRVALKQEFIHLMDFVTKMTAVSKESFVSEKAKNDVDPEELNILEDKIATLGAALSIVFYRREECLNSKGSLRQEKIAPLIQEDLKKWFGDKQPRLNIQGMQDLIRQHLKV